MSSPSPTQPTPAALEVARLVSHCWDLFSDADKKAALLAAYVLGADLADAVHGTSEEAHGDAKDYRRVAVKWAFEEVGILNEVERELWRSQDDDLRVGSFRKGFEDRTRELKVS